MNETIVKIVDTLFADLVETEETRALHDEIMNNCQERYSDLTRDGLSPDDATHAVVESLKGMEEVLAGYPRKEPEFSPSGETSFVFDAAAVQAVEAFTGDSDLEIAPSPDEQIHLECGAGIAPVLENGVLKIQVFGRKRVHVGLKLELFHMKFGYSNDTTALRLPASLRVPLNLRTISGGVEMQSVPAQSLTVSTASGDISLSGLTLDEFAHLQTSSGDTEARNLAAAQLNATTASGDLRLGDVRLHEQARLVSASGDVEWEGSCPALDVQTISGDLKLHGDFRELLFKTTSGDVRAELLSPAACLMKGQTVSGDMRVRLPLGTQAELCCQSRFGDVRQRIPSAAQSAVRLELTAVSGDITVE